MTIHIHLDVDDYDLANQDQARIEAVASSTLQTCSIAQAELTVLITSDEVIRKLNYQYRQLDTPTDVLSFQLKAEDEHFILPPEMPPYLGDVIISAPTAARQAAQKNHSTFQEILLLLVHGILHLVGFDHMTPADKAIMWQKQGAILTLNNLKHVQPTE